MPETRSARADAVGATIAGLIVVAFCLILLWHDPLVFWNDDYQISILPVFADVARSWGEGHWPLLSPFSWVCSNLAGEFQYGTFSVFVNAVVVLIWKFPLLFAQQAAGLSITHLFVLAVGGFMLARGRDLPVPLSILVALVAALNGWIICWGATDWFGALGAFAWLPWAWWGMERALDPQRTRWRFLWPAPFVYLLVTGGFPYTVVMLAVIALWLSIKSLVETRRLFAPFLMLAGIGLGFGLSAPAWLALLDYARGSARYLQPASAHWQWLVPPKALPAFLLPGWTVAWTDFLNRFLPHTGTELACGLVPPAALIAGLVGGGKSFLKRTRWDLFLLLAVLLISMLPSAGVFRWSFRWLPLIHVVLALTAAEALRARGPVAPGLIAVVLVSLTTVPMFALGWQGRYAFPLTWILLSLAAAWAMLEFLLRSSRIAAWLPPAVALAALLATYLCIPPNCGVPRFHFTRELLQPAPLDPGRLYLGIYPPPEFAYRLEAKQGPIGQVVRPGSTSMWAGLRFVNGYSPIRPAGVAREFQTAIHGEIDADMGKLLLESESSRAGLLEQLGVDGMVVASEMGFSPPAAQWELVFANEEGQVFHRRGPPLGQVQSVTWIASRPNEEFQPAALSDIHDARNSIQLSVVASSEGPSLLTFSRPFFPGYKAWLDGRQMEVATYRGLIPVVELPAGSRGRLVLQYRPKWLVCGGGLSAFCAALWMGSLLLASRQRSRH